MVDIEKLSSGLKCCIESTSEEPFGGCEECPYNGISVSMQDCRAVLCTDSRELLGMYKRLKERHKMLVNTCDTLLAELKKRTGRWIEPPECFKYERAISEDNIVCSVCKHVFNTMDNCTEEFDYCPHCGAKMLET